MDAKNDRDAIEANADQEEYCFAVRDTLQDEEPVDEPEVLQGIGVAMQLRAFDLLRPEAATKAPEVDNGRGRDSAEVEVRRVGPSGQGDSLGCDYSQGSEVVAADGEDARRRQRGTGGSQ